MAMEVCLEVYYWSQQYQSMMDVVEDSPPATHVSSPLHRQEVRAPTSNYSEPADSSRTHSNPSIFPASSGVFPPSIDPPAVVS